jgi:TIR domain.
MILSLRALITEELIERYFEQQRPPDYVQILRWDPFRYAEQSNSVGRAPLVRNFLCPDGRRDSVTLEPEIHVLPIAQLACPTLAIDRLGLSEDDALWLGNAAGVHDNVGCFYFEPKEPFKINNVPQSISRNAVIVWKHRELFITIEGVRQYLDHWMQELGIPSDKLQIDFEGPSYGVQFSCSQIEGQFFPYDDDVATHLVSFFGLGGSGLLDNLDLDATSQNNCGVFSDGIHIDLTEPVSTIGNVFTPADSREFTRTVFLSHSHSDKRFVRNLAKALREKGIGVWVDDAEIRVGESLIEKLRSAIDNVDYVVAVLSEASIKSEWVKRELDIAMNHEIESKRMKVLPLLKDDCDLPGFLKGKLYADFRKPHRRKIALVKLYQSIIEPDTT